MAIPEQLAFGRTGWHGDQSVSLRSSLGAMQPLVNDIRTQHNALCDKLDADATVPGAYAAFKTAIAAVPAPTVNTEHVAQGGSYSHGDDAVRLRVGLLAPVSTLAVDLIDKHNDLMAALDAAALSLNNYASGFAVTAPAASTALNHFAQGGSSAHGDAGRQIGQIMVGLDALKTAHNAALVNLDADTVPTDNDYATAVDVTVAGL